MNEDGAGRLLGFAGARVEAAPERRTRVHDTVRGAWLDTVERRRGARMRRAGGLLAAAAAIVAVAIYGASIRRSPAAIRPVAIIEHVSGPSPFAEGAALASGAEIGTAAGSRMTLRLPGIGSLRVAEATRLRVVSPGLIELSSGAVYAETVTTASGLEVKTPLGTVRDIGTTFEVRVTEHSLAIRVRSGTVELRHANGTSAARQGTQMTLTGGRVVQTPIQVDGPEWAWIGAATPAAAPAMEGQTLAAFLDRTAAAQGWTVRYADPALQASAQTIVLRGSVDGLSPSDAIAVAVATSGLAHRVDNRTVVVFRP